MKISSVTSHTVNHFKDLDIRGNLDLQPNIQRNLVWSDNQSIYLIDTILKNLPLALFFIETEIDSRQESKWKVIDGQQRLTSILKFVKGELTLNTLTHPNSENLDPELHGKKFRDLSTDQQNLLLGYKLSVVELSESSDSEMRDMFVRLNINNVNLNKQELRNATYKGSFISLCTELAEQHQDWFSEQKIFSINHFKRMRDIEFVSELIASMKYGIQDKKKDLDEYYKTNENMNSTDVSKFRSDFNKTIKRIKEIFNEEDLKTTIFKKMTSFYSLFIAIYQLENENCKIKDEFYAEILEELITISLNVHKESKVEKWKTYFDSVVQGGDTRSNRTLRNGMLVEILQRFSIKRDDYRAFTETQKQILWHKSKGHKCGICNNKINDYSDMEVDHIERWSDGGLTSLANGRITHSTCNRARG